MLCIVLVRQHVRREWGVLNEDRTRHQRGPGAVRGGGQLQHRAQETDQTVHDRYMTAACTFYKNLAKPDRICSENENH